MTASNTLDSTSAALRGFGIAAGGAVLAASAWAAGLQESGVMFDDRLWREEVAAPAADGAEEGWYRLSVAADSVQVRAAVPHCCDDAAAGEALYVHVPGTPLMEGLRVNHLFSGAGFRPRVGKDYPLTLGKTAFSFKVESGAEGTQYLIQYMGITHRYLLGLPAAATQVRAIADLDGDRLPDFVVEVGGEVFLLLSSHAREGVNLPSAQLWAAR
jgi:hypothetical protein